ncbi:thiamine ABC transporter permease [Psychromonas marina]|uniref:Thiamine ABC transporter permease n=1 Tax=Psychromonas marina TaxID=88364 RepID=A0ABQ6E4N2_9GAMM|nr:ABC transporter permease subunit [Psychromonas marina]GLS92407.1 thiamine ABC transporter permease [Psychromonas marina]
MYKSSSPASISFKLLVLVAIFICFVPLFPALLGLFSSAFAYLPALGLKQFSLLGFEQLIQWPGLFESILLTLLITFSSTFLAALLSFAIIQSMWQSKRWKWIETLLAPILGLPHVTFAIGFVFLFSPSGLFSRVVALLTGDSSNATWSLIHDQYGLGLIMLLTLKEIPFILLMSLALLKQLNLKQTFQTAHSLGYSTKQAWQKLILPQWLVKIRFSLFAVAAYSLSVVDIALIIGPTKPYPLAVLVWQWFNHADINHYTTASAGALLLMLLAIFTLTMIRVFEWLVVTKWRHWLTNGRYSLPLPGALSVYICYGLSLLILPILLLWSVAFRWSFPALLPTNWSFSYWIDELGYASETINNSVVIALISASIALLFAIVIHEFNVRRSRRKHSVYIPDILIALPMLAPQISLLFGLQITALLVPQPHYYLWVLWAHIIFTFPYIYLALNGAYKSYDKRLDNVALSLGLHPLKVWWKIKRPQLMPAILLAWAVGMSVSLAQYLPTLMLGAGRIATITTEAVALASGQQRRLSAIYALLQTLLPFIFFLLAVGLSRYYTNKNNQQHSARTN